MVALDFWMNEASPAKASASAPGRAGPHTSRLMTETMPRRVGSTLPLRRLIAEAMQYDPEYTLSRFEEFRAFNATVAVLLSFLAALLWVCDYICSPTIASQTIMLRALFPLVAVPYVAAMLLGRSLRLSTLCWFSALLGAETLYMEILLRMNGGSVGSGEGFLFFLLPPFLMAGSVSLRLNLLSVLMLSDWPLLLSLGGWAPGLNWASYCVTNWPAGWLASCGLCAFSYIYRMNYDYQKRLELAASTDSMTGAANRSCFHEALGHAINFARRYRSPLAVIMLDIDHFKRINDCWGHATGDRAICHVVNLCRQVIREVDLVGRLGGEEFAILLPETSGAAAAIVAGRIRTLLHESVFADESGKPIPLTCSFGISAFSASADSADAMLRRADTALYEAKSSGRDRVVLSSAAAE